jgi:exoribonuclease R
VPHRQIRLAAADGGEVRAGLAKIRAELDVPADFPADVLAESTHAAAAAADVPRADRTEVPLVTIDPPGSMDLDQALHLERLGDGFRVYYAIADVASFVRPGGAIDLEAHRRGVTLYGPDARTPLHPTALSEGAASLLPDGERPALLWTMDVDSSGEGTSVRCERAVVRSRARLDYPGVQAALDKGTAEEALRLLRDFGLLREERERARGGVSLPIPDQEVVRDGDGWTLRYRAPLPVEGWNAQVSLMTGMAAAELMLRGEIGVLRTLPPADPRDLARLRRTAKALRVEWPEGMSYADFIRTLDPKQPAHAALLASSTVLLRGAGYTSFDGSAPEQPRHAALAAEYAHVTAPLRRLVDRYALEICVALSAGEAVPDWTRAALEAVPKQMNEADHRSHKYERMVLDLVEAELLSGHVGATFEGVVVEVDPRGDKGRVQLQTPAVEGALVGSSLPLGERVTARLEEADVAKRTLRFALA